VLNRGEAVNAMKRSIYTGRIAPAQAKRAEEMKAVADAFGGDQSARHLPIRDGAIR
jgi:hypothetical protein